MWTLISRMNVKRTQRRLGRGVLTAAIVIATATEVAMGLLPKPGAAGAGGFDAAAVGVVHFDAPGVGAVHLDAASVGVVESASADELPALARARRPALSL